MVTQVKKTRMLAEGALTVAMAFVLSYIKIPVGFIGGSIDFVMLPIIIFAARWGVGSGLISGLVFGTLKFFFAGGVAANWQSMLLDYSVAYMMVGLAGLMKNKPSKLWLAALLGCFGRFVVHYISGVTIYAMYMEEVYLGIKMTSPYIYSFLYNGTYMLPNTVIAVLTCALLGGRLADIIEREK